MRVIASIAITLVSVLACNMWALQNPPPVPAREPYRAAQPPGQPHGNTKVAIAWFSEVTGEVELTSAFGKDFQKPLNHSAVSEGNIIRTGMGSAEIELEDQSTIRVGPGSVIAFPRLELLPSGNKASSVRGLRGTIYVSLMPNYIVDTRGNDFELLFGKQQVHLKPSGHVRLEIDHTEARLVIRDGKGEVNGPFGSMDLVKKRTFHFDLNEQSQPSVVMKVTKNPMDKWDAAAVAFHQDQIATPGRIGARFFAP
jgi:hypothetical protein